MRALLGRLDGLREAHRPDVVVVNAENAAAGAGTSARQARDLLAAGVDVLTGGNHSLRKADFLPLLEAEPRALRPANIAVRAPGRGSVVVETPAGPVGVVNVMGAVFMTVAQSPFAVIDDLVAEVAREARHVLVDVHARPPARRSRWPATWTAASPRWSGPTPTSRPPTRACWPAAPRSSATSG